MSLDLALSSPGKQAIRERLVAWFNQKQKDIQLLSLPGKTWEFEKLLRPRFVIGVERDIETYREALLEAPREFSSTLIPTSMQVFLKHDLQFAKVQEKAPKHTWNAAWLDYCGPLSEEILVDFSLMSEIVSLRSAAVPVAITLLNGRESGRVNDRIEVLASVLRKGKEVDSESRVIAKCIMVGDSLSCVSLFNLSWIRRYSSGSNEHTGSNMIVIAGMLSPRKLR